jgi:hypothetical protein
MEEGQGPNWGCSANGKKIYGTYMANLQAIIDA